MQLLFSKLLALSGIALLAFATHASLLWPQATDIAIAASLSILVLSFIPGQTAKLALTSACAWLVCRYIAWRFDTLPFSLSDIPSALASSALLGAELYGCAMLLLGIITNALPFNRTPSPMPSYQNLPTVDIFIPTYSEPLSVVAPTLMAALEINYPKEKLNVYILDDGWPKSSNPNTPADLQYTLAQRSADLQELARTHGAHWIGRPDNSHAKAGNINHALSLSTGELILVLDADHVPTQNILSNTVGSFSDPKIAFVQTPHFFLNPDPIERNLHIHNAVPSENDMFYQVTQKGLDLWNASFFCGSAALIRRKALDSINGLASSSITEDAASSIKMHQKGWKSAYIDIPMVAGLQPENFSSFITQRLRWGMGMMQIWMKQNPLFISGLSTGQRLSYLSVILFWLFPLARTTFFIAPLLSIFFNLNIYPSGMDNFVQYTAPYILAVILSFNRVFGHVRAFLMSELFETLQSFYLLPAIVSTLLHPSKPTFKVTPKGIQNPSVHVSAFRTPFYVATAITFAGILCGAWRISSEPASTSALLLSLSWLIFNAILLLGALGSILEHPQLRGRPRVHLDIPSLASFPDNSSHKIIIVDANETSLLLSFQNPQTLPNSFSISTPVGSFVVKPLPGAHRDNRLIPVSYSFQNPSQARKAVVLAYGSSDRWQAIVSSRQISSSLPFIALKMIYTFTSRGIKHLSWRSRND